MIVDGVAIAPDSARKVTAQLELGSHGRLELKAESQSMSAAVQDIQVSQRLGSIPRTLTFNSGWTFTPGDSAASKQLNRWLQEHHGTSLLHRLESHLGLIFVALMLTVAVSAWTFLDGIPRLSQGIANALPASVYQYVGAGTVDLFDYLGFEESQLPDSRQQELAELFYSLDAINKPYNVTPQFLLKSWSGGMNAFALADGSIVMTDDMVEAAGSDLELASVMLHELGHVYHNHVMTQLVRASIISVVAAYVVGDVSGVGDILVSSSALGLTLAYSRDAEAQADDFAMAAMADQFGTVEPMLAMFERLADEVGEEDERLKWLSTHPGMVERIDKIESFQRRLMAE